MSEITIGQLGELIAQSKVGRVTRENLQVFLCNLDGGAGYTVTVDYGKSVKEMVVAGRYDWSNNNINDTSFKVSGTGVVTVVLELVHLNKAASSQKVLDHLEANGLRPATVEELLAFGATYPEVQCEFPAVALGSSWVRPVGNRCVPYLYGSGSDRELGLLCFVAVWGGRCRFLAVRKS